MNLSWENIVSVTVDSCPELTGKHVNLVKRLGCKVAEVGYGKELIILHCII